MGRRLPCTPHPSKYLCEGRGCGHLPQGRGAPRVGSTSLPGGETAVGSAGEGASLERSGIREQDYSQQSDMPPQYQCMYMCSMCIQCRGAKGECIRSSRTGVIHGCWDSNPDPLKEQPMLFPTETALQLHVFLFFFFFFFHFCSSGSHVLHLCVGGGGCRHLFLLLVLVWLGEWTQFSPSNFTRVLGIDRLPGF